MSGKYLLTSHEMVERIKLNRGVLYRFTIFVIIKEIIINKMSARIALRDGESTFTY